MSSAPSYERSVSTPLFIDAHADVPNPLEIVGGPNTIDAGTPIDVDRLRAGRVGAVLLAANIVRGPRTPDGVAQDRKGVYAKLDAILAIAEQHPDKVALALTADAVSKIAASGRTAIVPSLVGAHALGEDLSQIETLYRKGVRVFGMVHTGNVAFVDSSRPYERDIPNELGGLSDLGRHALMEANRLGLLVDAAQFSTDALMQTLALSRAPVLVSHAGVRALVDHARNLSDKELDALAAAGGVLGVVAFGPYIRPMSPSEVAARDAVTAKYGGLLNGYEGIPLETRRAYYAELIAVTPKASLDDYLKVVHYAVRRMGVDHVALSSDFNQGGGLAGWADASEAPNVVAALRAQGYSAVDVDKLCGGNVLRLLRQAQENAGT